MNLNFSSSKPNVLQNSRNLISSVVNQAIIRPLGMPSVTGISGLVMDILDEEEISLDSDITDHFVEKNFAIQDHVALRPVKFSVKGYVGEQVDEIPNTLATIFTQIAGLTTLGGLAPRFGIQDSQFYAKVNNAVQLGTNVLKQARNVFQLFNQSSTTTNRQQAVYQFFYNMWKTRQLCTVETPFAIFDNMAIESVRAFQSGENNVISEFVITFKQIQTVASIVFSGNVNSLEAQNMGSISSLPREAGGRFEQMVAAPVSLGTDAGRNLAPDGSEISVANTSQNRYIQQAAQPNVY